MNEAFDTERNETRAQITEVCRSTCRTKLEQTQGLQGAAEKKKSRMETCARAIGQVSGEAFGDRFSNEFKGRVW